MKSCVLCQKIINDRSYRSLSSTTSQEQYKEVFKMMCVRTLNGLACNICASKLNRVLKLNSDMETKVVSIQRERDTLLSSLKMMAGVRSVNDQRAVSTPKGTKLAGSTPKGTNLAGSTPKGTKRVLSEVKFTPTPKSKVKKGLFVSPSSSGKKHVVKRLNVSRIDSSTQTKEQTEEFEVKVFFQFLFMTSII